MTPLIKKNIHLLATLFLGISIGCLLSFFIFQKQPINKYIIDLENGPMMDIESSVLFNDKGEWKMLYTIGNLQNVEQFERIRGVFRDIVE